MGEPNADALLQAVISVKAFGPGGDASGDVGDEVTLILLSRRPMMFQNSEGEMQDRVGAFESAVYDDVGHGLPPERSNISRDVGFRTHLDVFRRALLGDLPACVKPMTVRLQPSSRAVGAKPRASLLAKVA